jgi:Tol biopolymer transport system component
VAVIVSLAAAPSAFALLAEQPVLTSARNEAYPAAAWNASGTVEYLVFAKDRRGHRFSYDAYLRSRDTAANPDTVSTEKLNGRGLGYTGGIDPPWVIYQQVTNGQSDLKLYNITTGRRTNPEGVNTSRWEWHATISGDWILFGRRKHTRPKHDAILLKNSATGQQRTLASVDRISLMPGQVNGSYATWTRCLTVCNVYVYDIANRATRWLPRPSTPEPLHQYASAVTPDGTVYLTRSGRRCGQSVRLVRYGASDPPTGTVIASLPAGRDLASTFARVNPSSTDLFYDRGTCSPIRMDIYKVTDG